MDKQARFYSEIFAPRVQKLANDSFTPRMVGFMLSRAWVYLVFFSPALLLQAEGQSALDLLNNVSRDVLIATLLIASLFFEGLLKNLSRTHWCFIPAAIMIFGTLLVPFASETSLFGQGLLYCAAILTGIGSGICLLLWGSLYSKMSGPLVAAEASLAYALASLIVPACFVLPSWAQVALVLTIMIGSTLLLARELNASNSEEEASENGYCPAEVTLDKLHPVDAKRLLAKIAIGSIVLGFVINVLRYLYERQDASSFDFGPAFVLSLSAIMAGVIVLAVLLLSKRLDLAFSYRPVLWLLALGCFLLPLFSQGSALPYFFARTGYVCYTILAWVMLADLAYRSTLSPFKVFGIGQAACTFGLALGALSSRALNFSSSMLSEYSLAITGILVLALIVMYTLILTERDISHMIAKPVQFSNKPKEVETPRINTRDRCEALAARYGLGERATEVMTLYSRGRSRTRIEQELYISKGTVNFHLRNIYSAFDIHSRQELLDLLDDETLDEDPYE